MAITSGRTVSRAVAAAFPLLLYYQIEGEILCVLGLVHERRYPDFLKDKLGENQ